MNDSILGFLPLGFPWPTVDPFLFCVHHDDGYPNGNGQFGPAASLEGRQMGMDFEGKDGWRMYHGMRVPGFPSHPHRGFETVTIARRGLIDHSDSLGAAARFGQGDVQWLTAGAGIVHSEMFPLLNTTGPNPAELFQIWLNLPAADKMAPPHFSMLWNDRIPRVQASDDSGRRVEITLVAGAIGASRPPPPPPRSWASRPDSDVMILTLRFEAGASWTLPAAASAATNRTLYFFDGPSLQVAGRTLREHVGIRMQGDRAVELTAGDGPVELLLLQGRPIGEPVAQHGPFVMNTTRELQQAFQDYQRTRFGGWPWPDDGPVHGPDSRRFARRPDGVREEGPA